MDIAAVLTPNEVAELSGAPKRLVEKAIEERILSPRRGTSPAMRRPRRMLPAYAVAYATALNRLGLTLSLEHKKRLADAIADAAPAALSAKRTIIEPAVEIDIGQLVGDALVRTEKYRAARDAFIVVDEEIKGGTPVIRGTRMTVYSVLGRIEHGDTIDAILAENPDLTRDALEAAVIYARTHPLVGRPSGRPWVDAE
ncbi:MAG TPA: DUF433 domain-containing protein [Xanthobacteraceae bacterium]|nr:DUF433 domain-containing protein [Xanthobacteraceae bacterium]